jgi:prolyl oligopeptidase
MRLIHRQTSQSRIYAASQENLMTHLRRTSIGAALLWLACAGSQAVQSGAPASASAASKPTNGSGSGAPAHSSSRAYPAARVQDVSDQIFGQSVRDPYRWLEDAKWPEVQAWITAEDDLGRAALAKLPGRDAIAARLRELLYVETVTPPNHRGNRFFYTRRRADQEKAVIYFREGERGKEQVLLDPNALSPDGSISVHGWVPTLNGKSIAYSLHKNNADYGTLHVMNVATRKVSNVDVIENVRGPGSWTPKGDGFYYSYYPEDPNVAAADRYGESVVRFHQLGTDPQKDAVVREKTGDPKRSMGAWLSRDGHWLLLSISKGTHSNDVYYRDMRKHDRTWLPLAVSDERKEFDVSAWKDRFYIHTNDGAKNWRVYKVDANHPERANWKEIIPEDKEAVLERVSVVANKLSLVYLRDVKSEIELRTLDGAPVRKVPLPGIGSSSGILGDPEQDDAYFTFSSFTHPPDIYKTSVKTGTTSVWFSLKVPIDPTPYEIEQLWFASKDRTKVPMFVVHRKDMPKEGSTPFILTGYGGFNIPMLPAFSAGLYPWLEAGGGYAVANMRGGGEFGEAWHEAGMLAQKQNAFDDFIGAAEHLIKSGYTRPERLAIRGGSNGGLLVGAAMTQRPDLFRAVICQVPLLDMVRYHLFGLGKLWISEYGSPEQEADFKTLYAYSPYHHVVPGTPYPAVLMLSADSDDRVDPVHARKMVAALQAATSSDRPIWMRVERNASHGGADLVKQSVEQGADIYAFLMHELGVAAPGKSVSALDPR